MEALAEALGFGVPLSLAAGVFAFFYWIDTKVSAEAKAAIASWFKPTSYLSYNKAAVAGALVELFDKLYSKPLWSWRAFGRSAIASVVVTFSVSVSLLVVRLQLFDAAAMLLDRLRYIILMFIGVGVAANIASDYASLFAVRYWLLVGGRKPLTTMLIGPVVGTVIILIVYFLKNAIWSVVSDIAFGRAVDIWGAPAAAVSSITSELMFFRNNTMLWSAIAVHLWLPLFALGVLFLQALNAAARATGWMEWFLAGGKEHPLQAVGYVAAAIVFCGATVGQWLWR